MRPAAEQESGEGIKGRNQAGVQPIFGMNVDQVKSAVLLLCRMQRWEEPLRWLVQCDVYMAQGPDGRPG